MAVNRCYTYVCTHTDMWFLILTETCAWLSLSVRHLEPVVVKSVFAGAIFYCV